LTSRGSQAYRNLTVPELVQQNFFYVKRIKKSTTI